MRLSAPLHVPKKEKEREREREGKRVLLSREPARRLQVHSSLVPSHVQGKTRKRDSRSR